MVTLRLPVVTSRPTTRPARCPHCGHRRLHRHGQARTRSRDPRWHHARVWVERSRGTSCGHTVRHASDGVSWATQIARPVVLAARCWGLGLSPRATSQVLGDAKIVLSHLTGWRDARALAGTLRWKLSGRAVLVLGVDGIGEWVAGQ